MNASFQIYKSAKLIEYFLCSAYYFTAGFVSFLTGPFGADPNFSGNVFRSIPSFSDDIAAATVCAARDAAVSAFDAYRLRLCGK